MTTRETQTRIVTKAIELFNLHGTRAISTNHIADECEISRGNLHYHFRTKEELIQTIFHQIDREMNASWYDDHLFSTMKHMRLMFERQMKLIWDYRFFYRELITLLHNDGRLKLLFMDSRRKRVKEVRDFFVGMVEAGFIQSDNHSVDLDSLVLVTWLISDQWLPHLDMNDLELNEENIEQGFHLIFKILQPHFTKQTTLDYMSLVNDKDNSASEDA